MYPLRPSITDRTDVIQQILIEAQAQAGLTDRKIMYQFSLPHFDVDSYLTSMIRNGLLLYDAGTKTYRTTEKGSDFLETIRKMYELDELLDR